jgi:hypothetical protein
MDRGVLDEKSNGHKKSDHTCDNDVFLKETQTADDNHYNWKPYRLFPIAHGLGKASGQSTWDLKLSEVLHGWARGIQALERGEGSNP